jgi:phospholipid-binding lipoprotein MlaA
MSSRFFMGALLCLGLVGCATPQAPDPFEKLNRKVFGFNEDLDRVVLTPVATTYQDVTPKPVRKGVSNVFSNLKDFGSAANLVLQGRPIDGVNDLGRFATNSTFGVAGIFDVATPWGMEQHGETFGRTLAVWGVEPGAYIVLPLFGPSTTRSAVGMPVDSLINPLSSLGGMPVTAGKIIDGRTKALSLTKILDEVALDKYLFVRDAYLQRQRKTPSPGDVSRPDLPEVSKTSFRPPAMLIEEEPVAK